MHINRKACPIHRRNEQNLSLSKHSHGIYQTRRKKQPVLGKLEN
jgi:hypothetical protein